MIFFVLTWWIVNEFENMISHFEAFNEKPREDKSSTEERGFYVQGEQKQKKQEIVWRNEFVWLHR